MPTLRATLVTPLSGPLARYGRAGADALRLWADATAELPHGWGPVELVAHDAHPDPAAAMRTAVAERPHVLIGPYGSSPAAAAVGATDRPVWNHGGAGSRLAWPRYRNVINVLAPAARYYEGAVRLVRAADPRAREVGILHAATGFASDVAYGAADLARSLGFTIRVTTFTAGDGTRAADTVPDTGVLLVAGGFADELAVARTVARRPHRAVAFVGAGVAEVLAPLGDEREGFLGPAQWTAATAPDPDEGPDAEWFVRRYRDATGTAPPYPAAQAFAAGVLCARCLRDAGGPDDGAVLAAAGRLRCTTLFGAFRLDGETGLQAGHQPLTVQWQNGRRYVVWPESSAERPMVYPRVAPTAEGP